MKLLPDQGVQAMRPVRVTSPGASLSLPLRMAAIGTGDTVGISIWVVSDGRYEPQNFGSYHIDDSQLVWDFATSSSNYTTLRAQTETANGNKTWEIESSLTINEQVLTNVILAGGQTFGAAFQSGAVSNPYVSDPTLDYLPVGNPLAASDGGTSADAGTDAGGMTAEEARTADIATLFAGLTGSNVRITRMRSDIAHAAMTVDLRLQASSDQGELSNVRTVTQSVNASCPIYSGCTIVGNGTPAQAAASVATGSGTGTGANADREPGADTRTSGGGGGCAAAPATSRSADGLGVLLAIVGLVTWRHASRPRGARTARRSRG
jgi:hypothetical protein